jgi:hypothetical protein
MSGSLMLYSAAISAILGLSAMSLDHGLRRRGMPLRWVWIGSICGSVALTAAALLPNRPSSEPLTPATEPVVMSIAVAPIGWAGKATGRDDAPPAVPSEVSRNLPAIGDGALRSLERLDRLFLGGWVVTSTGAILFLVAAHGRMARRRRIWRRTTVDGIPVLVSRDVGPAVVGFLNTAIVVPAWVLELDTARRRLVLAHEVQHKRAGDAPLLLLALFCAALMPWNLPLWWQVRRMRHAVELDCDHRVMQGTHDAVLYSELLIEVGERASAGRLSFAAFAESTSFLAERIRNLMAPPPHMWRLVAGGCLAIGGLVLVSACEAPRPTLSERAGEVQSALRTGTDGTETDTVVARDGAGETNDVVEVVQPVDPNVGTGPDENGTESESEVATPAAPESTSATVDAAEPNEVVVLEILAQGRPNRQNIYELVRRLHPDIYEGGLNRDRALWIAIDNSGNLRRSWVGPNLYMAFEDYDPRTWASLPEGSPEAERALAEHREAQQKELRANVPDLEIRSQAALHYWQPAPVTLHFMMEATGIPIWGGRNFLARDVVVRTSQPMIAHETLPAIVPETISWQGEAWTSMGPARVIRLEELHPAGEVDGTPLFVSADSRNTDVVYRLQREPNVFLPFTRQRN